MLLATSKIDFDAVFGGQPSSEDVVSERIKLCHYDVTRRACVLASEMLMRQRFWYYLALFSLRTVESESGRRCF